MAAKQQSQTATKSETKDNKNFSNGYGITLNGCTIV